MFGFKKPSVQPQLPSVQRDQLVPRIKHRAFLHALEQAGVPAAQRPLTSALCGELLVTYAFDLPDSFVMATPHLLRQAGIEADEAAPLATANLMREVSQPEFNDIEGCGLAHVGGDLEATLLLADPVWQAIEQQLKGPLLAVAPRRNRLLVCDGARVDAVRALPRLAEQFFSEVQDQHGLSRQIMVRQQGRWQLHQQ